MKLVRIAEFTCSLARQVRLEPLPAMSVQLFRYQLRDDLRQQRSRFQDLLNPSIDALEIEDGSIGDVFQRRLSDDDPAGRAALGPDHLLILEQPHCLAKYSSTHIVTLGVIGGGPEHLTDGPPSCDDVFGDERGDTFREFGVIPTRQLRKGGSRPFPGADSWGLRRSGHW